MEKNDGNSGKIKKLFRLTIQWKMVLVGLVIVTAFMILILGYILPGVQKALFVEKEEIIKRDVVSAWSIIDFAYQQQQSGMMTDIAAQFLAMEQVAGLRYGEEGTGYFWISDADAYMIMNPVKPEMNNQDLSNYKDPAGKAVFLEMVNIAKQQGEGVLNYSWQYGTDAGRIEPINGYVKFFEPWGWVVGTEVYTVDINRAAISMRNKYMIIGGSIAIICVAFLFILSRMVGKNIRKAAQITDKLATGDTYQKVNIKSGDETGQMGRSLGNLVNYLYGMSQLAEHIAQGDLTVKIEPKSEKDTLGNSFVKMVGNLRAMMEEVQQKVGFLNQVPAPIMVTNPEGKVIFMNQAGATAVGKTPEECIGKRCYSLLCSGDCKTERCAVKISLQQNRPHTSETIAKLPSGDVPIRYTGAPVKDNDGKVIAAIEYVLDVSNEKAAVSRMAEVSENLAKASAELTAASEQSGSATEQIASVSQQVAKGAEEQTRGINEVNMAIAELAKAIEMVSNGSTKQTATAEQALDIAQQVSSAAEQTATGAQEAAAGASQAAEVARQGSHSVEKTIEDIRKININMKNVADKAAELGKHSEEIGGMIAVIDDIASQTNLLALNAAIEAARAGEQGRGFAVVADEVKKLAERTAKETKEISSLVNLVQKGVAESVKASVEGAEQADKSSNLANEAGTALIQILDAINKMTDQIGGISAAAEEMSAFAQEMVKAVEGVNEIAKQNLTATTNMADNEVKVRESTETVAATIEENSASTEQMSASAEEISAQVQQVVASSKSLSDMAAELKQAVALFKFSDDGHETGDNGNGKKALAEQDTVAIPE